VTVDGVEGVGVALTAAPLGQRLVEGKQVRTGSGRGPLDAKRTVCRCCPAPLPPYPGRGRPRELCSRGCQRRAATARRREARRLENRWTAVDLIAAWRSTCAVCDQLVDETVAAPAADSPTFAVRRPGAGRRFSNVALVHRRCGNGGALPRAVADELEEAQRG
jgi:hypothetical protein